MERNRNEVTAARDGIAWLLDLQNRDGGIPTFCKGWGRFPFDRSCPDITAHAIKAISAWQGEFPAWDQRLTRFCSRALAYLQKAQRPDGAWVPLWFGNQHTSGTENPVYGTAQVVTALAESPLGKHPGGIGGAKPADIAAREMRNGDEADTHGDAAVRSLIRAGRTFLRNSQNADGGWGGGSGTPSSLEETALALRALGDALGESARCRAERWLQEESRGGTRFVAAPIGLYFSRLWYAEMLYPVIHLAALQQDA